MRDDIWQWWTTARSMDESMAYPGQGVARSPRIRDVNTDAYCNGV